MKTYLKRFLGIALALLLVLSCVPVPVFAAQLTGSVTRNVTTGELYGTISEAILEAEAGQTVQLLADAEENILMVTHDVTLDLNGYELKADYVSCFGDIVDTDAEKDGTLKVDESRILIQKNNAMLPVKTGAGYKFVKVVKFNTAMTKEGKFAFQPVFEAAAHDLLRAGAATTGVTVNVDISWKQEQGTRSQGFVCNDDLVAAFVASYTGMGYTQMFTLKLTGADALRDLGYTALVKSDTGVAVAASIVRPEPAGNVTTDGNDRVAESVTLQNSDQTYTALVPEGTQLEANTTTLTLVVTKVDESQSSIDPGENEAQKSVDVHIDGIASDNTVPMTITLPKFAAVGLNEGNIHIYHVEDGKTMEMSRMDSVADFAAHNQYCYDPVTGDVVLYMATFSEIALFENEVNAWNGAVAEGFSAGTGTEADPYIIANADQLAYLNKLVSNGEEASAGKYYKLTADINFGGSENPNIWYPIGYWKQGSGTNKAGETWYTYGDAFRGVFDGNGHTITGICQNTWTMDGSYSNGYWNEAMGLFGYVYGGTVRNLTVDNFYSEGEYAPTGCVAAYAANAVFENIAITGSHPQTYNTSVAAVVGRDGRNGCDLTFRNITVDSSNTVSALWGSWDVGAAGLLGYLGADSKVLLEDCNAAATIDVYNDVCGNYQYYWYRYCGMLIGTVDKTKADGSLDLSNITARNCTVNFGDRHEYYYCEFEKNSQASYTEDFQFSRVPHSELIFTDSNGNGRVDTDEAASVSGCTHSHSLSEDKRAVHIPFYQIFGGYGWGVDGITLEEYNGLQIETDRRIETGLEESVDKFLPKDGVARLESGKVYRLGDLFSAVAGADIHSAAVTVGMTDLDPDNGSAVTMVFEANADDWTESTVTFTGYDTVELIIQDYRFCNPAKLTVSLCKTVTRQTRLLPDVETDLPAGALASAPGVQFSGAPYAYTDTSLFAGRHITRIGIPVKTVQALDENQTFTLSVVKTTSDAYQYVSQNVLKLPLDQLGDSTTVNKWVYVDVDLKLAADETLAFGMPDDTVTWGYSKTNLSRYNFRSATGSWSSPIKESILFDVYATQTLVFEQTEQGLASVTKERVLPNALKDFPESAIAGGNPVEFSVPPYSYVNQNLFAGKHITRIGIPVQTVRALDENQKFQLSIIKKGSGSYQYVSQQEYPLPLDQLGNSTTVNRWIYIDVDLQLAEDETLAFGGEDNSVIWAWKRGLPAIPINSVMRTAALPPASSLMFTRKRF